jgi:hypothetical protein
MFPKKWNVSVKKILSDFEENAEDVLLYKYGTKIPRNFSVSKTHTGLETKDVSSAQETHI